MQALTFVFAFVAVLALIGVAAWLVRRFAGSRLGTNTNRGRMPRLAVIDAAAVDGRRRLVLVPDSASRSDSDGSRSEGFDHVEPQPPEPPSRPARPSFADEVRRPAPAAAERRGDPLTGFTPEPLAGRAEPHSEPMPLRMPSRNEPMMPR